MAVAKRRAIDHLRREEMREQKHAALGRTLGADNDGIDLEPDEEFGDDLLALIFTACHPALPRKGRIALTLKLLGGLTTTEISRAFLVPEATIAQRIVRAKRTLAKAEIVYEVPSTSELDDRLPSVLEIIYLIFNEGYSATAGDDWVRPALCEEALRLGRILAEMTPKQPEVHGLVALMEIQASRLPTRVDASGDPVLLLQQDRRKWDHLLIHRGLAALERAEELEDERGTYALQAAIAACHARARTADETDWERIAKLYDELAIANPSPVVELNRAVAHGMSFGPEAGLKLIDDLQSDATLAGYHLLPTVRGDLLAKIGLNDEARQEFERAASLTRNTRERDLLLVRARSLSPER
jgi:predicted RNA polymerase sigma factor